MSSNFYFYIFTSCVCLYELDKTALSLWSLKEGPCVEVTSVQIACAGGFVRMAGVEWVCGKGFSMCWLTWTGAQASESAQEPSV